MRMQISASLFASILASACAAVAAPSTTAVQAGPATQDGVTPSAVELAAMSTRYSDPTTAPAAGLLTPEDEAFWTTSSSARFATSSTRPTR
jgi:hypothetical protein